MTLIPSSSHSTSPTGAAGGDLGGSYPNPTVVTVNNGNAIANKTASATQSFAGGVSTTNATHGFAAESMTPSTNVGLAIAVSGDTQDRFVVLASGKLQWSAGSGSFDTDLARSAAGALITTGSLFVGASDAAQFVVRGSGQAACFVQGDSTRSASNQLVFSANRFGQTGGMQLWGDHHVTLGTGASPFTINTAGKFVTIAGNEQTTVGAAGAASALPAQPTKYVQFIDSTGATLVFPAYASA